MNITSIGALPWKEILLLAPGVVDSARRLYDGLRSRRKQEENDHSTTQSLASLQQEIRELKSRIDEIDNTQAQLAELITRMTTQEEALARGLQYMSRRQTLLLVVSGIGLLMVSAVVVLVLLL